MKDNTQEIFLVGMLLAASIGANNEILSLIVFGILALGFMIEIVYKNKKRK